jgi:hypothetical protein
MSAWAALWAAPTLVDEAAAAERAVRLKVDAVSRRASAPRESRRFIARANGRRERPVIASLVSRPVPVRKSGQRRPPAAPPSRGQSYFFFAFFFAVFLAAFFFAGI